MLWLCLVIITLLVLFYYQSSIRLSTAVLGGELWLYSLTDGGITVWALWGVFLAVFIPLNSTALRLALITRPLFQRLKTALPPLSHTERVALEAGNTWWEAELFSGNPQWQRLQDLPASQLSNEEQAFLDGPVETLCAMLDDWQITHELQDLPAEVWDYIRQHQFFALMIPKAYGGLAFSEAAHSEIVMKIASRSTTAAVTVMVPNSLGPAKLLLQFGTEAQKAHYLPRLARGEEIPAFALTGPLAGSDAGAMPDQGIVCYNNEGRLGIRLNWAKRYITLGPVATVLGLAFKLYDPDHLLGGQENIGISVALIPTDTAGVSIGKRHKPLDSAFQNGPNWGKDVFIGLDQLLGGVAQAGQGWQMLMQCLSTGRAVSLPALSVGAAKLTCRNTGAYARIRQQFNLPIGEFEGVAEALARIAGTTYMIDAARKVTNAALDQGEQPAVIAAILKYHCTETMRRIVNDGMDIQGGSGICLGPSNYLGRVYQVIPVGITVEGANILTRTMMIFGQGAIRCHPYIQQEMAALHEDLLPEFDALLGRHSRYFLRNLSASLWLGLSNARFQTVPGDADSRVYYRQITRLSAAFAMYADFALMTLGGALKRKERLSGLFADALSYLYLASCVLKHYQDQGCQLADAPLLHWACQHSIYQAQQALRALFWQLPLRPVAWVLRACAFPLGKAYPPPNDKLTRQTANLLLADSPTRDHLSQGIYINRHAHDATGRIELAFTAVLAAAPTVTKLKRAQKLGQLGKGDVYKQLDNAVSLGLINPEEAALCVSAQQASLAAIAVDDFDR